MSILIGILTVLEVIVCLFLILIILMQRPRQEGLGAAFGDSMASQMWGAQTTNVLQKFTVYLAVALFVLTVVLAVLTTKAQQGKTAENKLFEIPTATAPAAPTPATTPAPAAPAAASKPAEAPATPSTPSTTTTTANGVQTTVQKQPGATVTVKQPAPKPDAKPAAPATPPLKLNSPPAPAIPKPPATAAPQPAETPAAPKSAAPAPATPPAPPQPKP